MFHHNTIRDIDTVTTIDGETLPITALTHPELVNLADAIEYRLRELEGEL